MRKILLVLIAPLVLLTAYAQKKPVKRVVVAASNEAAKSSKPTKEETMDWLATKMKEHMIAPRIFLSYNKGIFVYKKMYGATGDYCTTTLDLNKITGISPEYSVDQNVTGVGILYTTCEGGRGGSISNEMAIGGNNYHDYSEPFDFKSDNALMERVTKAFKALSEFNGSKKSEGEAY